MTDFSPESFLHLTPEEQQTELKRLVAQARAADLVRLKQAAADKALARKIAQAIHQLKSRGVKVAEPEAERRFVLKAESAPEQAALSQVDGEGSRLVWLFRPAVERGFLFQALVSRPQGLKKFAGFRAPVGEFNRILKNAVRTASEIIIVAVAPDFARRQIFQAAEASRKRGSQPPEEFLALQDQLGPAPDLSAPHPLFSLLEAEAVRAKGGLVYESPKLLAHQAFRSWFFSEDSVRACALKLEETAVSPLVMAERQKEERREMVISASAREALATEGRGLWKERLIENAYFLYLRHEKDLAEIAFATALALDDPETLPPLFPAMMRRAFRFSEEAAPPAETAGRIIFP